MVHRLQFHVRMATAKRATFEASAQVLAATILSGCPPEPEVTTATVETVADHPTTFAGERVALVGEIGEVLDERTFVIESDDLLWDDEVVVLARRPIRFGGERLGPGEDVAVSGLVHYVGTVALERELGWGLSPELEVQLEGRSVIVADAVSRMKETARWSDADEPEGVVVSITAIDAIPSPWILSGQTMKLEGVPIHRRVGQGLWVGFGGASKIYVASDAVPDELEPGDRVDVEGTLRRTPALETAKETWQLYGPLLETIAERPLYLDAKSIRSSGRESRRSAPATVEEFIADPKERLGTWVFIEDVVVDEVISDRAFWMQPLNAVGDDGRFLGVVREDVPAHEMIDIDAGQRLEFTGLAMDASDVAHLAGTLETDARAAIDEVPGFITMYWADVTIRRDDR